MVYDNEYHLLSTYHILGCYICFLFSLHNSSTRWYFLHLRPWRLRLREKMPLASTHRASEYRSSIFAQRWCLQPVGALSTSLPPRHLIPLAGRMRKAPCTLRAAVLLCLQPGVCESWCEPARLCFPVRCIVCETFTRAPRVVSPAHS